MTPAPIERVKINLYCRICDTVREVWSTTEARRLLHYDAIRDAYLKPHYNCLHHIDPDAPLTPAPRRADPERSAHSKRVSSGGHRLEWRVTQ